MLHNFRKKYFCIVLGEFLNNSQSFFFWKYIKAFELSFVLSHFLFKQTLKSFFVWAFLLQAFNQSDQKTARFSSVRRKVYTIYGESVHSSRTFRLIEILFWFFSTFFKQKIQFLPYRVQIRPRIRLWLIIRGRCQWLHEMLTLPISVFCITKSSSN